MIRVKLFILNFLKFSYHLFGVLSDDYTSVPSPSHLIRKPIVLVRKSILPLTLLFLSLSFAFFPPFKAGSKSTVLTSLPVGGIISTSSSYTAAIDDKSAAVAASMLLFDSLHLGKMGLSFEALQYAYIGYQRLRNKGVLSNSSILTVCDFSQPSRKKRMYIINVDKFKVLLNTYVAHGKNSGLDYAKNFSNIPESLQSSLGFYVTKETYFGKHGLSLKLDGLEKGINDKAEERAVVIHGADYIGDQRIGSAYMGRSFGCPAVPQVLADKVIKMIKNGSCLFIYHPSNSYLHGSRLLNG